LRHLQQAVLDGCTGALRLDLASVASELQAVLDGCTWALRLCLACVASEQQQGAVHRVLWLAIYHGQLGMVQWAYSQGAMYSSYYEPPSWLGLQRVGITSSAAALAASRGHLHVLRWLHEQQGEEVTDVMVINAAFGGDLAVMEYVVAAVGGEVDPDRWRQTILNAAQSGQLAMVQWVAGRGVWEEGDMGDAAVEAARVGHLPVLQYLLQQYPAEVAAMARYIAAAAAGNNHMAVLQWACDTWPDKQQVMWCRVVGGQDTLQGITPYLLSSYVRQGHVAVLQWVVSHAPPAAGEVVRGALQRGMADEAAREGQVGVLQWLHQQDPALSRCSAAAAGEAAAGRHLAVLQWLQEHHPTLRIPPAAVKAAASSAAASSELLEWLAEHYPRAQVLQVAQQQGAERGDLRLLKWLQAHHPEVQPSGAVWAAAVGDGCVLRWLRSVYQEPRLTRAAAARVAGASQQRGRRGG
jgi:hypothetical protein